MVGPRRRSREIALQILHQMDVSPEPQADADAMWPATSLTSRRSSAPVDEDEHAGEPAARVDRELVEELVRGVSQHRAELDEMLTELSRNWRIERMGIVERNVIRLALFELVHAPSVPIAVVINEAMELAKRFGTAEGAAFVNGLLDRAATELGRS